MFYNYQKKLIWRCCKKLTSSSSSHVGCVAAVRLYSILSPLNKRQTNRLNKRVSKQILKLEIDDEQVVLAGLEVVGKINVPESNPSVSVEKVAAIPSDEEVDDTVTYTPLLDKRKRAPALKSPFVDFGSAIVSSTPMEGLYALNDTFANLVSPKIEIGEGLLKYSRAYNCYEDGAKKFALEFRLGVDYAEDKTSFYHLACCDKFINDSHMNTIFYYLRKKEKYSSAVTLNFVTTDCLFDDSIQSLCHKFCKAKAMKTKMSHIHAAHPIAYYIRGLRIPCSEPWYEVDHVLFIINLRKEIHWVFGRLDLNEGIIFLYNSLRTAKMNSTARNAMKAYSVLLLLFFDLLGFWKNRSHIPGLGSDPKAPLGVVEIDGLPSHCLTVLFSFLGNSDCRAFVATFAEFFIHGKDFPGDLTLKFIALDLLPSSSRMVKGKMMKVLIARMRSEASLPRLLNLKSMHT
ncbi:hypothetical protein F8388_014767 [Cannabis sativa]|uniref:Ubiquitin-like protease family profile domain-containing protein n=1 Tax=Cannabis sativa TaxID=3483 RepID=A0A7J6GYN0_CANSA|nr:hypothetical protein F8388_014767 [Cannabis sativa]